MLPLRLRESLLIPENIFIKGEPRKMLYRGKAHVFGDNINTDYIIAGKYTKTLDYKSMAKHLFEDLDADFPIKFHPGDFVVAGRNFGCGSSREQAPIVIKISDVKAVIAKSFSRIFFRNAINLGLPVLVCDTDQIQPGDLLEVGIAQQQITNLSQNIVCDVKPLPPMMREIVSKGGLVEYLKEYGDFLVPD